MRRLHLLATAAFLAGCSGSDGPTENDEQPAGTTVTVSNNAFDPSTTQVPVNGTVTWQWSSGGVEHNVTFQDGPASGNRSSGTFPRTFQASGSYPYVCTIHAAEGMTGVVNVAASGGSGGAGGGDDGGGGDDDGGGDPGYP